jgi:hypothetical protein
MTMDCHVLNDRSIQLGKSCVRADQGIAGRFSPVARPIKFEYIARCILTAYTAKCDDAPSYSSRLSTAHKARVVIGGDTTITVDELFLILEMAHFQSGDKLQKKIYRNTFKILEKNASDTTLTKNVLNVIRKDTIALFNEGKTPALKVLKVDLTKVKGTKCADCCGCPTHCVDYRNNTWCGPRFHKENKTRDLLTGVEGDVFLDHEGNLVSVDDDYSQSARAREASP